MNRVCSWITIHACLIVLQVPALFASLRLCDGALYKDLIRGYLGAKRGSLRSSKKNYLTIRELRVQDSNPRLCPGSCKAIRSSTHLNGNVMQISYHGL